MVMASEGCGFKPLQAIFEPRLKSALTFLLELSAYYYIKISLGFRFISGTSQPLVTHLCRVSTFPPTVKVLIRSIPPFKQAAVIDFHPHMFLRFSQLFVTLSKRTNQEFLNCFLFI